MPIKRKFSQATLKKILKQHAADVKLGGPRVEYMIFLDYLMFIRKLASEADGERIKNKATKLKPEHIQSGRKQVLRSCRG